MSDYKSADFKCPFYISEFEKSIKCEGIISGTCIHNFKSSALKEKNEIKYCMAAYSLCPFYKILNSKYS